MDWSDRLFIIAVLVAVPLLLIVFPLYLLFGGLRTFALKPLQRCFEGIRLSQTLGADDVQFVYHTYRGFLFWVTQEEHCIVAPAEDAERLLNRLLRFNLTWGMMSYGLAFIPFIAVANYYSLRKSIRRQVQDSAQRRSL